MSQIKAIYIDHMGNDNSIVNAARLSLDKRADQYTDKENISLIRYLASGQSSKDTQKQLDALLSNNLTKDDVMAALHEAKHRSTHWTPFAHTAITVQVTAPVPIRTQCFKHKQGLVENEESRRYISSRPQLFTPDNFYGRPSNIKQGRDGVHHNSQSWCAAYMAHCEMMIDVYEEMILDGVAPEQARFILPQGCMVNWQWTGNLVAFTNFYMSRTHSTAQKEVSEVAHAIKDIIRPLYPHSWDALTLPNF